MRAPGWFDCLRRRRMMTKGSLDRLVYLKKDGQREYLMKDWHVQYNGIVVREGEERREKRGERRESWEMLDESQVVW
jgi:hypothetical protein